MINNNDEEDFAKRDYFYQALLIEEPEAHLHPQKQNTFFKYLNTFDQKGIQLFITSHSPTITAKAKLYYLIVLQKQKNKISEFTVAHSELDPENIKYLRKFLDVTKSQLFFSNGTILVEGISETLLLPASASGPTTPYRQRHQAIAPARFRLFPFRSPLLRESLLLSFPRGTEMFQFPRFPLPALCVQAGVPQSCCGGFPHSDIHGSTLGRQLAVAYRSHPRPSSASGAKASTVGSL